MIIAQAASFADRVGTAPGTTTMMIPYGTVSDMKGLGVINETDRWRTGDPYGLPGTVALRVNSDGSSGGLLGAMGLNMATREITRTLSGGHLGTIPTDFDLGRLFGYTPVHTGWIARKDGPPIPGLGWPDANSWLGEQLAKPAVKYGLGAALGALGLFAGLKLARRI